MPTPQTERLGVSALDHFFSERGWLFREQTTHDYGIDAHVEIVVDDLPTGKIIALQIKSGASFFKEDASDSYIFRTDDKHVAYWVEHSMPVVVVLYNPDAQTAHWQQVCRESVKSTGKNWKIEVPKTDMFADAAQTMAALEALTQPEPYIRRLNRLRIDRHWMDRIEEGVEVKVTFDNWVNKSLPRYQITIFSDDDREVWPTLYTPGVGIEGMLNHFFPWADFSVDEDEYEQNAEDKWAAQCYMGCDPETGNTFYTEPFAKWYTQPEGLVPVSENGETETYILTLSLSEFGKSFIAVDDYLADPDAAEKIGFSLE